MNEILRLCLLPILFATTVPLLAQPASSPPYEIAPKAFPGDSVKSFYAVYGDSAEASDVALTWKRTGYSVTAWTMHNDMVASIFVRTVDGMVVRTPDGVLLGKWTFREVLEWARKNHIQLHELIQSGDGIWMLEAYFTSLARPNQVSVYVWLLPGSDVIDRQIDRGTLPLHSEPFLDMTVKSYRVERGSVAEYALSGGSASVHD